MEAGMQGGQVFNYLFISSLLVNLNNSIQNLSSVSNSRLILDCLTLLWNCGMNNKQPREV